MNLSRVTRIVVWLVLLWGFGIFLFLRSDLAWGPDPGPADKGLLIAVAILLAWPLFAEIDIFGVRIKQQLESIRSEIRTQLAARPNPAEVDRDPAEAGGMALRPLSDEGLERLSAELEAQWGKAEPPILSAFSFHPAISHSQSAALALAGAAGAEIGRLAREGGLSTQFNAEDSVLTAAWRLARKHVLTPDALAAFREMHWIARRIVDGRALTPAQARFTGQVGVELVGRLKRMQVAGE